VKSSLLAQYLYKNHRLDLPGIGTFLLDPSTLTSVENSKQRSTIPDGITFKSNSSVKESPELIAYISANTGKMKALASADLESHIELVKQFLNLGKPFVFEGIGTIAKKKQGEYEFNPISVPLERIKESTKAPEPKEPVTLEQSAKKEYESFLSAPKVPTSWRRPVTALLVIAGIALAIWGGYTISKNTAANDTTDVSTNITTPVTPPPDTSATVQAPVKPDDYKYVLQVSQKQTAQKRYEQLRTNLWDVKMETQDSIKYKLYLLLPMLNADTTHVLDSLTALTGKRVYIEHIN
jgi:hypothetical protein